MIIYIIEVLYTLHYTLMGKGSKRRKEDTNKYRDAWELIWGNSKKDDKNAKEKKANERTIKSTNTV